MVNPWANNAAACDDNVTRSWAKATSATNIYSGQFHCDARNNASKTVDRTCDELFLAMPCGASLPGIEKM